MAKRMLIDATHAEETRVVVLDGNRLDEFDFETSTKKQVKGNIYLAKITRVEPSLQAAFVDFGGNRHGFLAFSEIHPDYYRIPIGDRAPGRDERGGHRDRRDEQGHGEHRYRRPADAERGRSPADEDRGREDRQAENGHGEHSQSEDGHGEDNHHHDSHGDDSHAEDNHGENPVAEFLPLAGDSGPEITTRPIPDEAGLPSAISGETPPPPPFAAAEQPGLDRPPSAETRIEEAGDRDYAAAERSMAVEVSTLPPEMEGGDHAAPASEPVAAPAGEPASETPAVAETVETVGGDEFEEAARQRSRSLRHYKIQEVVKRRQIMLVQVTKEERGNKGAALTTYLSLAGRYCVLMPNTGRGGGVSRKITSATDRRRLKELLDELELPEGMGVIVRTAGSERSKAEIKRDLEYLLRLWDEIRSLTLQSTAPALIYEEGNLIKRSIRDLYARDIDEVLVEGEEGYKTAKAFMKMLMPSHAKRVQPYRDPAIPLLHRFQVESQIDLIHSPVVQLRSGGYIVINPTEALVAIDVNSGRSTKERNIEETALRTNLEAAEEIARQLRLRDLAGLIVIDFIDMEEHRNQGAVERRLKEGMKYDRARIQLGRISPFGLLELSRQRLRPSLVEASTQPCPHCGGTGHIRSTESTALHVLRAIEEEGIRRRSAEICIYVPTAVALYVLNQKRQTLAQIEQRYGFRVTVAHDDALIPPAFRLERLRNLTPEEAAMIPAATMQLPPPIEEDDDEEVEETEAATVSAAPEQGEELSEEQRGKRRRRRRRRRPDDEPQAERWSEPHDGSHDPQAKAPERAEDDGGDDGGPDAPMPTHHRDLSAGEGEAGHAPGEQLGENSVPGSELAGEGEHPGGRKRRRRGKRGGRRRGRGDAPSRSPGDDGAGWRANDASHEAAAEQVEVVHEPESLGEMERQGIEPAFAVSQFRAADETLDMAEAPVMDAGETLRSHHPPQAPRVEHRILNDAEERDAMPPLAERPQAPMREPSAPAAEAATPPAAADPGPTVPSPKIVTEKPANPKRGWWQRLIDS